MRAPALPAYVTIDNPRHVNWGVIVVAALLAAALIAVIWPRSSHAAARPDPKPGAVHVVKHPATTTTVTITTTGATTGAVCLDVPVDVPKAAGK